MSTSSKNICAQNTATTGTGTVTLGSAVSNYKAFGAGDDGKRFDIRFQDGTAWEVARDCLYTHSGTTLTRGTFEESSTGAALNLSGSSQAYVIAATADRIIKNSNRGTTIVTGNGSTTQNTTANTFIKVSTALSSVVQNPQSWWDSANKKFQPTRPGVYLIGFSVGVQTPDFILGAIYKNGTEHRRFLQSSANAYVATGMSLVEANGSTDYFEVYCYTGTNNVIESGSAIVHFTACWVGELSS